MKQKTIFNHIDQLTTVDDSEYFINLSEEDAKTYNIYMINRFLSMNPSWADMVNEIQQYSYQLKGGGIHRVYNEILPKKKIFLKYVKPKDNKKYNPIAISILKKYFEIGESQAKEYYDTYMSSKVLLYSFLDIIKLYGLSKSDYKKVEFEVLSGGNF